MLLVTLARPARVAVDAFIVRTPMFVCLPQKGGAAGRAALRV